MSKAGRITSKGIPEADSHALEIVAKRLMTKAISATDLKIQNVILSIGCTSRVLTRSTFNAEALLREADNALYQAKEGGRNRFVVYKKEGSEKE